MAPEPRTLPVPSGRVDVIVRQGVPAVLSTSECERVLVAALEVGGAPPGGTASLILSDDAELRALNEAHMGETGPTDVLSFPLLPPSAFPIHEGQDPRVRTTDAATAGFQLPPGEPVHVGDIVVSVERALAQASEGRGGQAGDRRWDGEDELRLLITHGALHLCGWDHAEPAERAAMRALESSVLGGRAEWHSGQARAHPADR